MEPGLSSCIPKIHAIACLTQTSNNCIKNTVGIQVNSADIRKKSSFIYYTGDALENVKDDVVRFAEREGLSAHARAVSKRFENK